MAYDINQRLYNLHHELLRHKLVLELILSTLAQIPLPLSLPNDETFASFVAGENGALLSVLQQCVLSPNFMTVYFWAPVCAGRSHLLHAACNEIAQRGQPVVYIPLKKHDQLTPALLDGMEQTSIICIDDIDKVSGQSNWELAIFDLYNRCLEINHCSLFITGNASPVELNLSLPDLVSRLEWGQVYKLNPLSDEQKLLALQRRAVLRGFELPDDVGQFLFKRLDRQMDSLFSALDCLDQASIRAQRKLTIPFVKEILSL